MNRLPALALVLAFCLFGNSSAARPADATLHWLAGLWCGAAGDERLQETWFEPAGGEMQGMSRSLKQDRVSSFEFLRISAIDGVPTYLAQPGGRPPTAFRKTAGGEQWIRFENPAHDFPSRIEYRRTGQALRATVSGLDDKGQRSTISYDFRRCAP